MDKYSNFKNLKEGEPAQNWHVRALSRMSQVAVIAPHGGSIEPGTSEVACAVAGEDLSLYLFEGRKPAGNRDLHITSTNFDEPSGLNLVVDSQTVVAIHGEGNEEVNAIYLGGLDLDLREAIAQHLRAADFDVRRHENPNLQGTSPLNICNRGKTGRGVQLELSKGLRKRLFASLNQEGRTQPSKLFESLVSAVRRGIFP